MRALVFVAGFLFLLNLRAVAMSIVAPEKTVPGKLWASHPSFLAPDSTMALALLAKGFTTSFCRPSRDREPCKSSGTMSVNGWSTADLRRGERGECRPVVRMGDCDRHQLPAIYAWDTDCARLRKSRPVAEG